MPLPVGVIPDEIAKELAVKKAAMPEKLLIPIAATDVSAIVRHVGTRCEQIPGVRPANAYLVTAECTPAVSDLRVWQHPRAQVLKQEFQVWVDASYTGYRKAYRSVFPDEDIRKKVVHHVMNRRYAQHHGFRYVRVVPISRSANSSSGFSENWGVSMSQDGTLRNRAGEASIAYADLAHLMSMLDMPIGGGVMENVRLAASLLRPQER